ncbi:MAG: ATP-binding cassette domain-containing protein [Actinobacteria bacterium]|nr:ATP-binding cassette domain-containing protein [Actinomycetota bacterium]
MTDVAIEVKGLKKTYGSNEAVRGIDLTINTGDVFALLGPNGAGKTTVIEILEGYRHKTSGEVSVLGHDPENKEKAFRERIGIVLQETGVDPFLTVAETIDLYRSYYPHPRPVDEVIEVVGLQEKRDERVKKLSGGQQRRLDVAIGLAGDPDLLFLDEPTTGFDPAARRNAWDMIRNLKSLGKTVLLTTHYMDEAQNLADRVAIIRRGEIVVEGEPGILRGRDTDTRVRFAAPAGASPPLEAVATSDGLLEIKTADPTRTLYELTSWAVENDVRLERLNVSSASLEDIYLELTADE